MLFKRDKIALLVAELFATFALTLIVLSVSNSQIGIPYFTAIAVGAALAGMILIFGKAPGLHANPAVTLGMWSIRKIKTIQAILFVVAQFMGAIFAWRLFSYYVESDLPAKTIAFDWRALVAEGMGTLILVLAVTAAVTKKVDEGRAAATIGIALTLAVMTAATVSNGMINPAVALGAQSWGKAYVFGPLIGGVLAAQIYSLLFAGERFALNTASLSSITTSKPVKSQKASTKKSKKSTKK